MTSDVDVAGGDRVTEPLSSEGGSVLAWGSWHVYQAGDRDRLLASRLAPCVDELFERGLVRGFFFIRYQDPDPHVRLRLRGTPSGIEESGRHLARALVECRAEGRVRLTREPYRPEVDRYGGEAALPVCEGHFELSSRRVLAWLARPRGDRPGRTAMGARDTLTLLAAALPRRDDAATFLKRYAAVWLAAVPGPDGGGRTPLEVYRDCLPGLEQAYAGVPREARRSLLARWHGTGAHDEADPDEGAWRAATRRVVEALTGLGVDFRSPPGQRLLGGLVHMHANRLGILNRDEATLSFLCHRLLAGPS